MPTAAYTAASGSALAAPKSTLVKQEAPGSAIEIRDSVNMYLAIFTGNAAWDVILWLILFGLYVLKCRED